MKKISFILAVLATALFVSCIKEEFKEPVALEEGAIAFNVGSPATRASESTPALHRGITIPLGTDDNGTSYYLEETVTELDVTTAAPLTRGTPAYTENIGVLYANNLNLHADKGNFGEGSTGEATYENMDTERVNGGWRYNHKYTVDPWPADGTAVGFYLNMPATQTGVTMTNRTEGAFTFNYTSPKTAAEQQDILFAYRAVSQEQYRKNFQSTGIPVLFNHALTGVKFAIGNTDEDIAANSIEITKIEFIGLKNTGTCTITPVSENNYTDNTSNYTSADAAEWTNLGITAADATLTAEFDGTVTYGENGSFKDVEGKDLGKYNNSFAAAGNANNLNDAGATQTFWLIPQNFDTEEGLENVQLSITYSFGGTTKTWAIDFGAALHAAKVNWQAGQIRTYTIRVDDVNVKIEDTVVPTATPNTTLISLITGEPILDEDDHEIKITAYGGTKSDVTITNTGNTDSFIRAALIGQWLDKDGNPVFGFTDYTAGKVVLVDSWYQDQFVSHKGLHGWFVDLPGYRNENKGIDNGVEVNNWILIDGYYYYKNKVAAGQAVPDDLFTSYTVGLNPAVVVAGEVKDVYFTLEIATQAVTAKNPTGGDYSLSEAWNNAGVTVTVPTSD